VVASSEQAVDILIGEGAQMSEAGSDLSVTKTELALSVAAANEDITCVGLQERVILACCNLLHPLASKILHILWREDVFSRAMTKLSLLAIAEGKKTAVCSEDHRVFASSCHRLDNNFLRFLSTPLLLYKPLNRV